MAKSLNGTKKFRLDREPVELPLIKRTDVNHNVRIFRFGLPDANDTLGLPPGQHISLSAMTASSQETGRRTCVARVPSPCTHAHPAQHALVHADVARERQGLL